MQFEQLGAQLISPAALVQPDQVDPDQLGQQPMHGAGRQSDLLGQAGHGHAIGMLDEHLQQDEALG
nr:hypothetical protein [Mycobacterium sp. DL440]